MQSSPPAPSASALGPLAFLPAGLLLALFALGASCGVFKTIQIDRPAEALLVSDGTFVVSARVAGTFDPATVEARIDGVDVIAALGLVPPIVAAGGVVPIGGDAVTISAFDYDPGQSGSAKRLAFLATGLSEGAHQLEVSGAKSTDQSLTVRTADFGVITTLSLVAESLSSHALLLGPIGLSTGGELRTVDVGGPFAGPPVGLSDGGELRSGFLEAAEARIAGGTP